MLQALSFAAIILLTAADQIIKYFVDLYLKPIELHSFIPGFIQLSYVENTGAAFGSFSDKTMLLTVVTAVVLLVLCVLVGMKKFSSPCMHWSVVLIIAGGAGNVIDRIFRGYVIDYLEFQFMKFAVFNFADCLVTVGAAIAIAYLVYEIIADVKAEKKITETEK